jgi:cytochrome P450
MRLLAEGPVARARMQDHDVWLILGYDAVRQVLADSRFSREAATRPGAVGLNRATSNPELLVSMDPPRHTRIRRLMAGAFTPRRVADLQPRVVHLVDELLDEIEKQDKPVDLVRSLNGPLPVLVICELLGVPIADRSQIRHWAGIVIAATAYTPTEIVHAIAQVHKYLADLIAVRRADPDDALISALIAANDEGDYLTPRELVSNVQMLLIAGHETTVSQLGNSVVTLFQHPDQIALLVQRPELLPAAVDELMRHSRLLTAVSPRVATADVAIGDVVVRAGETVFPLIGVANRDPAAFPDPHRFDITRPSPATHLALGSGPHYCLGAYLANLELETALSRLFTRFPTLAPAVPIEDLEWKTGMPTRSVRALPVTW